MRNQPGPRHHLFPGPAPDCRTVLQTCSAPETAVNRVCSTRPFPRRICFTAVFRLSNTNVGKTPPYQSNPRMWPSRNISCRSHRQAPHKRLARVPRSHAEQLDLTVLTVHPDPGRTPVHLGFTGVFRVQRHHSTGRVPAQPCLPFPNPAAYRRLGSGKFMLLHQTLPHPVRGVALLDWLVPVRLEPGIYDPRRPGSSPDRSAPSPADTSDPARPAPSGPSVACARSPGRSVECFSCKPDVRS